MLELRPNCECDLPPEASNAMICTSECTFCANCVNNVLANVCPNSGGGFVLRPIRPLQALREGLGHNHQQPSQVRVHTKYTREELINFAVRHKHVNPADR